MCRTDFDEAWLVDSSWRAVGKCVDCGWFGPGLHEVYVTDDVDNWADEGDGFMLALGMLLNDGVPDWRDQIVWDVWDEYRVFPRLPEGEGRLVSTWTGWDGEQREVFSHDHPLCDRATDLARCLSRSRKPDGESHICDNCLEARRWLQEWCQSWMYDDYLDDVIEHWREDEIPHSLATGRLVAAAKNRWHDPRNYRRYEASEVAVMVDRSIAFLRASVAA